MFSESTLAVTHLNRSFYFWMFKLVSLCTLRFLREWRSWSWSVVWDTDRRSLLSSYAISAGLEWVPVWSSYLRIISFTSLMFYSVCTDLGCPKVYFWATSLSPVLSIFLNSFSTPFTFYSYSGWPLTILVAPKIFDKYFLFVWGHRIASY